MQQQGYQVRFGMGVDALRLCAADADVIVWVDALPDPHGVDLATLLDTAPGSAVLIGADVPTSRAAAAWVLDYQTRVRQRLAIAVITASPAFAVDDFLAAGAVVDALAELGLDATSPEAAAAEAAYRGLRNAVAHLITASAAGRAQTVPAELTRVNPQATLADVAVIRHART